MNQEERSASEWQTVEHALAYLARADKVPHRTEGESVLLQQISPNIKRVLDLGAGNGRLLALVKVRASNVKGIALDFSEPMLKEARKRFEDDKSVEVVAHDLSLPLPASLGCFDAIVSSFAIHHLVHQRKRKLYQEVFALLNQKGVFCNFDHVSSSTLELHLKALGAMGIAPQTEDPSNKLLDVETQLRWLRQIGFVDVDCYWKWLELALFIGFKP